MTTRTWMTMLLAGAITAGWVHHAGAQPVLLPPGGTEEAGAQSTRRETAYYGWQILLTDATSVAAAIAVGSRSDDTNLGLAVFGTGYALGGPLVHLKHDHPGRALGSLALRAGLPALGAALVYSQKEDCSGYDDSDGACGEDVWAIGMGMVMVGALGMGVASVLDWTVLGMETKEVPVERGPTLVPQVSAGADGSLQLGVLGRF